MAAVTGIAVIQNYAGAANDPARVQLLLDLIPDPDTSNSSGAVAGSTLTTVGAGFLDEMSPAAAVQLRVELAALKATVV
jgi:hypothetical protein